MEKQERNSCYTYFKITGNFHPDDVSDLLGLKPQKQWKIGDLRRNGTPYDFAHWEYGRYDEYDVFVENQMMKTIQSLLPRREALRRIKQQYDVAFTLEIVPSIYAGGTNPCLAPNKEVIQFCHETGTELDIDLYVYDSTD